MTFTILFVGSRNVGRSPLAAALTARELRRIWPRSADEVAVLSAGVDAAEWMPVPIPVETVAERRGLELGGHRATGMSAALAERADLVLTMTRRQRAQLVLQYPVAPGPHLLADRADLAAAGRDRVAAPADVGRGERLEAKLRLVVTVAAARQRAAQAPADERQWDVFDPYGYSLDIHETVAATLDAATHALVGGIAVLTGTRAAVGASRTA